MIDDFILSRQSEELFLDFKGSGTKPEARGLSPDDRSNLAKAISGFGNSEGGVVVWGVDCRNMKNEGDLPRAKHPIADVRRFISYLEGAVTGCTVPAHSLVRHFAIPVSSTPAGFVVTHIPRSLLAPHQVLEDRKYYMRAGSSFDGVPHGVLQGMFGRPYPPTIELEWKHGVHSFDDRKTGDRRLLLRAKPDLVCRGPGLAADIFMVVDTEVGHGLEVFCEPSAGDGWQYAGLQGPRASAVARPDFRLAPEASVAPLRIYCRVAQLPPADLRLRVAYGCAGTQTHVAELIIRGDTLADVAVALSPDSGPVIGSGSKSLLRL